MYDCCGCPIYYIVLLYCTVRYVLFLVACCMVLFDSECSVFAAGFRIRECYLTIITRAGRKTHKHDWHKIFSHVRVPVSILIGRYLAERRQAPPSLNYAIWVLVVFFIRGFTFHKPQTNQTSIAHYYCFLLMVVDDKTLFFFNLCSLFLTINQQIIIYPFCFKGIESINQSKST